MFRFLQQRLLDHNRAVSLQELQAVIDRWVEAYDANHVHRSTGFMPLERL